MRVSASVKNVPQLQNYSGVKALCESFVQIHATNSVRRLIELKKDHHGSYFAGINIPPHKHAEIGLICHFSVLVASLQIRVASNAAQYSRKSKSC